MAVRAKGTVRNGSKRSPTLSPSLSTTKKPKAKKKATGAFKVLLNLLHITDKKRSRSEVPDLVSSSQSDQDQDTKPAASSTWSPETVPNDHISQDSSPKDRHCKSWSYYVHDPFDVFTGADDDGDDAGNAEVFFNDSYFEDDYCQDYRDNEQDMGSVKTPHLRGIQMGVDSLGTSVIEQTKTICGEFKRDCARRPVTRKRHMSLPDFKTTRTIEVMPCDEEEDLPEAEHDREAAEYHLLPPYTPPPLSLNIVFGELSLDDTAHSIAAYDFQEGTNKWEPHENQTRSIPDNPYSSASKEVSSGLVDYTSLDSDLLGNPQASQTGERRATYKDKRPSPLNINPVFAVSLNTTDTEHVPSSSSMYSECLTSDNNMDISPQEKTNLCDSQEQTNSSDDSKSSFITAQSSSVLLKNDTNSFPSSSDDDDTNAVFVPQSKVSPSGQRSIVGNKNLTRRRYTESGYDTCGKVSSTPNTPPDPEKKLSDSLNMTPHTPQQNVKPGLMLSALGNVTSAAALNKLDGLSTPPCSPRSPRFKFPSKRRPCSKNASITEGEQTPSKVSRRLSDKAKEFVAASPATNVDDMQCGAGARPKTNVQWAERLSSPSCSGLHPLRPISLADNPSVNYTDENGNCVTPNHITSASHQRSICFEFAATPLNKIPTPVSTSSPLQKPEKQSKSDSKSLGLLVIDVSPVKQSASTPTSKHKSHLSKGDSGVRKRRRRKADLSMDSSRTRAGRDLNNNLLKSRVAGSDEEIEVISPSSRDYLLLKRAADCIVNRISAKRELKQYMNMGRLVEYLNTFYHAEIAKLASENIRTVSDFRNVKLESCDIFTSERLTVENCIKELLFSAVVNRPQIVSKCADFAFENLHYISTTSDFLQASPELALMILSNNHSVVNGPHGFPLAYKESEGQVHRAVMKYLESHKSDRPVDQKLAEMLYSVTDPNIRTKDSHGTDPAKNCLHLNLESYHNATRRARRPYHEIKFRQSDTFVTTPDTRQEYLFQPYLSSALSSYPSTDLQRSPDSTSSPTDDIMNFCNSAHTLRKLYFSYRRHNKVPYITKIDLQYAYHGRKKMYSIGGSDFKLLSDFTVLSSLTDSYKQRKDKDTRAETRQHSVHLLPTTQTSSRADENRPSHLVFKSMDNDEACSLTDDDTTVSTSSSREVQTTTAVKLEAGEHVTGVAVQGDAVLHNVEITTSKGRQVRAHGLSDITREALWTPIPPPEETPYCLQALYAHAKSPSSRTYLRNIGAVWAVMSRPMNNLSV